MTQPRVSYDNRLSHFANTLILFRIEYRLNKMYICVFTKIKFDNTVYNTKWEPYVNTISDTFFRSYSGLHKWRPTGAKTNWNDKMNRNLVLKTREGGLVSF